MRRLLIYSMALFTYAGAAQPVTFNSAPPGAKVCLKVKGVLECMGETPLSRELGLQDDSSSKRVYFKKFGYQTVNRVVSAKDKKVNQQLERRDVLFLPAQQSDPRLKKLQEEVNAVLRSLIFNANSELKGLDAETVGRMQVVDEKGGSVLVVGLLVESGEHRKRILAARRNRDATLLARAVVDGAPAKLLAVLGKKLQSMGDLKGISLSVDYQVASATLTDETLHFYRTQITGQHQRSLGDGRTEVVTEYTTTQYEYEAAKVEDELGIRTVLLSLPLQEGAGYGIDSLMRRSEIYINDNRRKKFERVGTGAKN